MTLWCVCGLCLYLPSPICPGTSTWVLMPTPSGLLLMFTLVSVQLDVLWGCGCVWGGGGVRERPGRG